MNLKAILLDDELHCTEDLKEMLVQNCPDVEVITTLNNPDEAVDVIRKLKPDLLFLDIQMPNLDGFSLLKKHFPDPGFQIIFVTAFENYNYVLNAIRLNALDYLQKPVREEELIVSIAKAKDRMKPGAHSIQENISDLISTIQQEDKVPRTIRLKDLRGYESRYQIADIIRFQAEDKYVNVAYWEKGDLKNTTVQDSIKRLAEILEMAGFQRVHRSYLINIHQVAGYNARLQQIRLKNGEEIAVARRERDIFEEVWKKLDT